MAWIPYPTALNGYGTAGQDQAAGALPYTAQQLNDPRVPLSVRGQMQAAQTAQSAATSTAPYTSGLAPALKAASGFVGGQLEGQATQAAAPYQGQDAQPSTGLLASLLRGGTAPAGQDDGSTQALGRKSDRRLKSDVTRIGTLPNGLAVYRYRLQGGAPEIGLMADEVMTLHPGAVWEAKDGFLRVDYSKAVL